MGNSTTFSAQFSLFNQAEVRTDKSPQPLAVAPPSSQNEWHAHLRKIENRCSRIWAADLFALFFPLYEMNHLPLSIQHQQCESVALGHSGFRPTKRPVSMFWPGRPFIYFFWWWQWRKHPGFHWFSEEEADFKYTEMLTLSVISLIISISLQGQMSQFLVIKTWSPYSGLWTELTWFWQ